MPDISKSEMLGDIYITCGHLFVTHKNYVHMHFYVSEEIVADYIATRIPANVRPHKAIYDVAVQTRKGLADACIKLLKYPLAEERKRELNLALGYAKATDRAKRNSLALQLKGLLRPPETAKVEPTLVVTDED